MSHRRNRFNTPPQSLARRIDLSSPFFGAMRIAMLEKVMVIPVNNRIANVAVCRLLFVSS